MIFPKSTLIEKINVLICVWPRNSHQRSSLFYLGFENHQTVEVVFWWQSRKDVGLRYKKNQGSDLASDTLGNLGKSVNHSFSYISLGWLSHPGVIMSSHANQITSGWHWWKLVIITEICMAFKWFYILRLMITLEGRYYEKYLHFTDQVMKVVFKWLAPIATVSAAPSIWEEIWIQIFLT